MAVLDEFMDLDNHPGIKNTFTSYRFFGKTLPGKKYLRRWIKYNKTAIPQLQCKHTVYLPSLRIETKLLFQFKTQKDKKQKCRKEHVSIKWDTTEHFIESMKECIEVFNERKSVYNERKKKKMKYKGGKRGKHTSDVDEETEPETEQDDIDLDITMRDDKNKKKKAENNDASDDSDDNEARKSNHNYTKEPKHDDIKEDMVIEEEEQVIQLSSDDDEMHESEMDSDDIPLKRISTLDINHKEGLYEESKEADEEDVRFFIIFFVS